MKGNSALSCLECNPLYSQAEWRNKICWNQKQQNERARSTMLTDDAEGPFK